MAAYQQRGRRVVALIHLGGGVAKHHQRLSSHVAASQSLSLAHRINKRAMQRRNISHNMAATTRQQ